MMASSPAISLARRPLGESDRLTVLYTRDFGKLAVRFVGVLKPRAKLKALSEPLVWGDYRLYLREGSEFSTCTGGGLVSAFPALRADLEKTRQALHLLELVHRLTPERSPSPAKYELLTRALRCMELSAGPWLGVAFTLRLLELAGFAMPWTNRLGEEKLWEALHKSSLAAVSRLPGEPRALGRLRNEIKRHLGLFLDQPLKTEASPG